MESSKVNKLLTIVVVVLLFVSIGSTFYKTILMGDFSVVESPIENELIEE